MTNPDMPPLNAIEAHQRQSEQARRKFEQDQRQALQSEADSAAQRAKFLAQARQVIVADALTVADKLAENDVEPDHRLQFMTIQILNPTFYRPAKVKRTMGRKTAGWVLTKIHIPTGGGETSRYGGDSTAARYRGLALDIGGRICTYDTSNTGFGATINCPIDGQVEPAHEKQIAPSPDGQLEYVDMPELTHHDRKDVLSFGVRYGLASLSIRAESGA